MQAIGSSLFTSRSSYHHLSLTLPLTTKIEAMPHKSWRGWIEYFSFWLLDKLHQESMESNPSLLFCLNRQDPSKFLIQKPLQPNTCSLKDIEPENSKGWCLLSVGSKVFDWVSSGFSSIEIGLRSSWVFALVLLVESDLVIAPWFLHL